VEVPNNLLNILLSPYKNRLLESITDIGVDMSDDFLRDFFEEEHAERVTNKQDFTPESVTTLIAGLQKQGDNYFETAAGIGGLVIAQWVANNDIVVNLEEISGVTISYLLLHMSIRNIAGIVKHANSITDEVYTTYVLTKGDKFSDIEISDNVSLQEVAADISNINPPFSLKWDGAKGDDENGYPYPPKGYADYLFILRALSKLNDDGQMIAVVPHGLLFRGGKEGEIRKKLIENNHIKSIIGLPANLFSGTQIPVVLLVLTKAQTNEDVLLIDASNEFEKNKNKNQLTDTNIDKIVETYNNNNEIEKYSRVVSFDEIKENNYNLNITRYIDTFEDEPEIDLAQVTADLLTIDDEIKNDNNELLSMLDELVSTTPDADAMLQTMKGNLKNYGK
ncbi:MAG: N-6 DNA methylase, partial [Sphingobacteriia bacterium]|nr:N-6 DNA methylase [Sphingobacteriia bacterium]